MKSLNLKKRGDRLRAFIKARYRKQKIFAELVGIDETQVSFYVNDEHLPGLEILSRFQKAGLSIDWYLSGDGEMYYQTRNDSARAASADVELLEECGSVLSNLLTRVTSHLNDGKSSMS